MNPEGPLKGEKGDHDNTWQMDNDFCRKQKKITQPKFETMKGAQ
jgi:hypothetical protein